MSKSKFKHIPTQLQNAVIGFGGSLPGVGKSYTKDHWAEKLRKLNYQVKRTCNQYNSLLTISLTNASLLTVRD